MTKKEARQQVKEWMKKLDKNYIEKADQSIFEQVKELKARSHHPRSHPGFLLEKQLAD